MTSPTNTAGLADLIQARIGQDFEGECHLTDDEAQQIISALVTAASAQARIAELETELEREKSKPRWSVAEFNAITENIIKSHAEEVHRAQAAEARVAELEAAKWEAQHVDTMNDLVAIGLARDAAEARADRLAKGIVQAETMIDDAIKGIQNAPLGVVTDTIWTADACPMTVVDALQLARAALQQEPTT